MQTTLKTKRNTHNRIPKRGSHDLQTIHAILDKEFICHVGFVLDGQPYVIPTCYGRCENNIYIHGATAGRMFSNLEKGFDICVTVTLVDGLVLARSAFNHSVNYRSVVIFGKAILITDEEEKMKALEKFTEHAVPGRWKETRPPTPNELKMTSVLAISLEEASAKIRQGPPVDDDKDHLLPYWAGVVPLRKTLLDPIPDPKLRTDIAVPESVKRLAKGSIQLSSY